MSSSFYGIKSRYNNAVRRYELLKVATSYENSKICNTDLAVISNITVLLKQIENFQGMIKNANVVCENKEFSNTSSDLTNLSNDVQKMLDDYTQINADIYNCSQLAFEKMMDEYRDYDLKAILTSDHLSAKINNGDAGVVVITPDKTFEKTVTKLQHGADIDWCLAQENLAYEGSIWDLVENNNTIIMQLCYGEAIIWLNSYDKRTEYQQSELTRIMTDIQQIIDSGYDLNIEAAICQNRVINKIENEEILGENNDNIKRAY